MHMNIYIGVLLVSLIDFFTKLMVPITKKVGNRFSILSALIFYGLFNCSAPLVEVVP